MTYALYFGEEIEWFVGDEDDVWEEIDIMVDHSPDANCFMIQEGTYEINRIFTGSTWN